MSKPSRILVTGANGQLGQVLTSQLSAKYGAENVLSTDIQKLSDDQQQFEFLDILNKHRLYELVKDYEITQVYHLAAILSASGEWNIKKTWDINLNGLLSMLSMFDKLKLDKLFFPSTIAVFGNTTPRVETPQHVPMLPETVYGMSKVTGEMWCNYYNMRYGVDVRSVRYPGIIGHQSMPGGGTTDYAVEIYHEALKTGSYECFLDEGTRLPMMFIDDAIRATLELMDAETNAIKIRSSYNLAAVSFSPAEVAESIRKYIPEFTITYKPDFRQKIAESWTESIDDSAARQDWKWQHRYDLDKITYTMLTELDKTYNSGKLKNI